MALDRHTPLPESVVRAAIQWQLRLDEAEDPASLRERLREWCTDHPSHALAWARLCELRGDFRAMLDSLPERGMAVPVLRDAAVDPRRRRALKGLLALMVAAPVGWSAYRHSPLSADLRTGAGEQRRLTLEDGTRLFLNTRSSLDVRYDASERRLALHHGEIWVRSGADGGRPVPRPLRVAHEFGVCETLDADFLLRDVGDDHATLWVARGVVIATPRGGAARHCGEGTGWRLSDNAVTPTALREHPDDWTRGHLMVDDMRLGDFLAELGRYRNGYTGCDPAVAGLRLSGVFQLRDPDALIDDLARLLPVAVAWRTPWWVKVEAA
ncbi:FecR domain-containing protein [Alloalcanivorax sp. C16-2]|uniref:FecR domain-containing protein n=1 Tax=Alloalcanivorax sp. C16-2 TaxID=3390052 RepID=UPI003970DA25